MESIVIIKSDENTAQTPTIEAQKHEMKEKHKGRTKDSITKKALIELYLKGKADSKSDAQIARDIGMNYHTFYARIRAKNFLTVIEAQKSLDKKDFSNIFTKYFEQFENSAHDYLDLSERIIKANLKTGELEKALKIVYALQDKQKNIIDLLLRIQSAHSELQRDKEHTLYWGCADCPRMQGLKTEEVKAQEETVITEIKT